MIGRTHRLTIPAILFLFTGCQTTHFRAETVIDGEGRIERAIHQEREATPETGREASNWDRLITTHGLVEGGKEVDGPEIGELLELPIRKVPETEQGSGIAAWGRFDRVEEIPEHYRVDSETTQNFSKLQRDYDRRDYGLVVEHRWRETLTEVVELDDLISAQAELADIAIDLSEEILSEAYPEHDMSALVAWFAKTGRPILAESAALLVESSFRSEVVSDRAEMIEERLLKIFNRHGIEAKDWDSLRPTLARTFEELIQREDGKPVEPHVIAEILDWAKIESNDSDQEEAKPEEAAKPSRLDEAAEKVIDRKFGSRAEFNQRMAAIGERIFGVRDANGPRTFHYQLTMPGRIVETNGTLLSGNTVVWKFGLADAYPFGYAMTCRALQPREELQAKLFEGLRLTDRRSMQRFVKAIEGDDELIDALRLAAEQNDPEPLHEADNWQQLQPVVRDAAGRDEGEEANRSAVEP